MACVCVSVSECVLDCVRVSVCVCVCGGRWRIHPMSTAHPRCDVCRVTPHGHPVTRPVLQFLSPPPLPAPRQRRGLRAVGVGPSRRLLSLAHGGPPAHPGQRSSKGSAPGDVLSLESSGVFHQLFPILMNGAG